MPAATRLRSPSASGLYAAPPDIRLPGGMHGPCAIAAASLPDTGKEFGQAQVASSTSSSRFAAATPSTRPSVTPPRALRPWASTGRCARVAVHMHLLGVSMRVVLNPGTPKPKSC